MGPRLPQALTLKSFVFLFLVFFPFYLLQRGVGGGLLWVGKVVLFYCIMNFFIIIKLWRLMKLLGFGWGEMGDEIEYCSAVCKMSMHTC